MITVILESSDKDTKPIELAFYSDIEEVKNFVYNFIAPHIKYTVYEDKREELNLNE